MKNATSLSLLLATLLLVPAASAAELSAKDQAAIATVERLQSQLGAGRQSSGIEGVLADYHVPALSIAYFENGQVRWKRAYGQVVASKGVKATPDTLFQAASLSKAVAAVCALRLVDQGKLTLDEDVNSRLIAWKVPFSSKALSSQPVTLRELLNHSAGVSVSGYPGYVRGGALPTLVQSLNGVRPSNTPAVKVIDQPGKRFAYSGGGYSIVQLLLSEIGHKPYQELAEREVFAPVGMTNSTLEQPLKEAAPLSASGHDNKGNVVAGGAYVYPELAAAGLWTTPSDYASFLIALQRSWAAQPDPLLNPATARTMMTPAHRGYGLGVEVGVKEGRLYIAHSGSNEGFKAQFVAYLDGRREGAVVMTNGENGDAVIGIVLKALEQSYDWTRAPYGPRLS